MDKNQNKNFADFLVKEHVCDTKQADSLLEQASRQIKPLKNILITEKVISEDELLDLEARFYNIPRIKLSDLSIPESVLKIIPYSVALKQKTIAFEQDGALHVAIAFPENTDTLFFLEKKTGKQVVPFLTSEAEIDETLNLYSREIGKEFEEIYESVFHEKLPTEWSRNAEKIVDAIIHYAKQQKASDIHLEPRPRDLLIRYRIDGVLHDIAALPKSIEEFIVSRIKVLANLRTDEHASAQDGRFKFISQDLEFTIRTSILPVYDGEKVVLRLLTALERNIDLASLGFSAADIEKIGRNYKKPHGMILVTGPTGSGKTTTLYSVLTDLNRRETNITTLEDPIEYKLEGINQIQVNPKTNLTFAHGLRSILRQDPNIIMVGEIRDEETAGIAINAALTGHLVLSTLHTNSAATTLPRLMEMGIEPFLVASTVSVAIAQRLVRKLCQKCMTIRTPTPEEKELLRDPDFTDDIAFPGEGCDSCSKTGYRGRTAVAEVLEVTDPVRDAILKKVSPQELEKIGKSQGMRVLLEEGLDKVKQKITSLAEVLRTCSE